MPNDNTNVYFVDSVERHIGTGKKQVKIMELSLENAEAKQVLYKKVEELREMQRKESAGLQAKFTVGEITHEQYMATIDGRVKKVRDLMDQYDTITGKVSHARTTEGISWGDILASLDDLKTVYFVTEVCEEGVSAMELSLYAAKKKQEYYDVKREYEKDYVARREKGDLDGAHNLAAESLVSQSGYFGIIGQKYEFASPDDFKVGQILDELPGSV